jgi:hypothetical protein
MKRFTWFFLVLALAAVVIGCEKKEEAAPPKDMPAVETPAAEAPAVEVTERLEIVNTKCPIMGTEIDPKNVPDSLYREFNGQGVGFCCPGCPADWDALPDSEKEQKLAAAQ